MRWRATLVAAAGLAVLLFAGNEYFNASRAAQCEGPVRTEYRVLNGAAGAAPSTSALDSLGLAPGDRLVVYRQSQERSIQKHDYVIVKSLTSPPFLQMVGDPQEDIYVSGDIWGGWYEPPASLLLLQLFAKYPPSSYLFVDVGCNLGWFTLLAASQGYEVLAFDMQARVLRMLRSSIALSGFGELVHVHQGPLGSDGASVTFNEAALNWGGASVKQAADGAQDVMTTTALDTALARFDAGEWFPESGNHTLHAGAPIVLLKIDVEGFEEEVFRYGNATLARAEHVIIEFRTTTSGYNAINLLIAAGFNHFLVLDKLCCSDPNVDFLSSTEVVTDIESVVLKMKAANVARDSYVNLLCFRAPIADS